MKKRNNGLFFALISLILVIGFVCFGQGTVYGQCGDGEVLIKKTKPNGEVRFKCVNEDDLERFLKKRGWELIWVTLDMTQNYYTETGELFEGFGTFATYEYDDFGRRTVSRIDSGIDGVIDSIQYREYDEDGNNTILEVDNSADGTIDMIRYFYYDEDGNQTAREIDWDSNGIIDDGTYWEYDRRGNVVLERKDENGDGSIDSAIFYSYFGGKKKKQILSETDTDNDGSIDSTDRTFEYYSKKGKRKGGKERNLLRREVDYGDDGTIDKITRYTYTNDNRVLREDNEYTEYADPPGLYISSVAYGYDENGNKTLEQLFWTDGVLQERIYTRVLLQEALNLQESLE